MIEKLTDNRHLKYWADLGERCALERAFILITGEEDEIPDTIAAQIDVWTVKLTSEEGQLVTVSGARCGSEIYSFEKSPEDESIVATGNNQNRLLSPQLHNITTMVLGQNVSWAPVPEQV